MVDVQSRPQYCSHETYRLLSLVPAVGWKAVYHEPDGLFTTDLSFLGVADLTVTKYRVYQNGNTSEHPIGNPDVYSVIVGVVYRPESGLEICEQDSNFCGVVPPGGDVAAVTYNVSEHEEYQAALAKGICK